MCSRTVALPLLLAAAVGCAFSFSSAGCRRDAYRVTGEAAAEGGLDGIGEALFLAAGLTRWYPDDAPDVGVGLEGLYGLVDGAADSYWERGITGGVFQNFRETDGGAVLEVQQFAFRGVVEARAFFEAVCRDDGGEATVRERTSDCLFSTTPAERALLWGGRDVLDLRLYGNPGSDPIADLVAAFHRVGPVRNGGP